MKEGREEKRKFLERMKEDEERLIPSDQHQSLYVG